MEGNPYSAMLKQIKGIAQGTTSQPWVFATVKATQPFIIEVAGKPIRPAYVNRRLVYEIETGAEEQVKAGDTVAALISNDGQDYTIICKVVKG